MRRKLVAFALSLGFLAAAYFGGAVGTVLSPVGFGGKAAPQTAHRFRLPRYKNAADSSPSRGRTATRNLVVASSISLASLLAGKLTHSAAPPLPTKSMTLWGPHFSRNRKCSEHTRKAPRRPIAGSSHRRSYSTHVPAAAPAGAGGSPCGAAYRSWLCSFLRWGSSRRKIWSMFRLTVCNSLNRCFCS